MSARCLTASSRPCRIGGSSSIGSSSGRSGRGRAAAPPRAGAGPAWQDDCLHAVASGTTADAASSVWKAQPVADLARAAAAAAPPQADAAVGPLGAVPPATAALLLGGAALAGYGIKKVFDTPSRAYDQNVGEEYDAWTEEGVLEYYWGEHIHLGYYTDEVCAPPFLPAWAGSGAAQRRAWVLGWMACLLRGATCRGGASAAAA